MEQPPVPGQRTRQAAVRIDGSRVRELRHLAGASQGDIAERAQITTTYLSYIESGKRATVSPRVFAKICDALGVEDRRALISAAAA